MSEEGKPLTSEVSPPSPLRSHRAKVLLGTVMVLCVAAAMAACAVVLSTSHRSGGMEDSGPKMDTDSSMRVVEGHMLQRSPGTDLDRSVHEEKEEEKDTEKSSLRVARGANGPSRISCYSDQTDKAIPAAHISGVSRRWRPDQTTATYDSHWECESFAQEHTADPYVHGGMCFLQSDKSLYVPTCGYYYVYSQILYKVRTSDTAQSVFHQLKFERNCSSADVEHESALMTYSSVAPSANTTTVTTHTGGVVKLCQGGRVWVEIPSGEGRSACCPTGGLDALGSSFFGGILVAKDNCDWPPRETLAME